MPKDSEERANARKEEIINACAALYETVGYKDITIRDIGKKTSFTRTAIYHYFQTKEEIFLALLQREHEAWAADLEALAAQGGDLTPEAFAGAFAATLGRRGCMLKLMSMNLYDMEGNSRMENLVAFKRAYAAALRAAGRCLERYFPRLAGRGAQEFLYGFFPFLFGVYPYTSRTEKQAGAMAQAGVPCWPYTAQELVREFTARALRGLLAEQPREDLPE